MKKVLFIFVCIILIFIIVYNLLPTKIAVLGYHDFSINKSNEQFIISKDKFDQEMKYLRDNNYKSLTLKEMKCYMEKKCHFGHKSVLITMDDGWKNELLVAAPILKKYKLNATIFYIGSNYSGINPNFLDKKDLEVIKKKYPNIEIASHSYDLHHDLDYKKNYTDINSDFNSMNKIVKTKYFAYPYGLISRNYLKVLKSQKYSLAFTFGPGKQHRKASYNDPIYKVPRLNISNFMSFTKYRIRLLMPF